MNRYVYACIYAWHECTYMCYSSYMLICFNVYVYVEICSHRYYKHFIKGIVAIYMLLIISCYVV